MTEAVYLDLSKVEYNEIAYLIGIVNQICEEYCMYREGVFDEFMGDEYGEQVIADTLKAVEALQDKITVKPHLNLH